MREAPTEDQSEQLPWNDWTDRGTLSAVQGRGMDTASTAGHTEFMSPERYDFLVHSAERGHLWREAIRAHRAGEPGVPAREAIRDLAEELGLELRADMRLSNSAGAGEP